MIDWGMVRTCEGTRLRSRPRQGLGACAVLQRTKPQRLLAAVGLGGMLVMAEHRPWTPADEMGGRKEMDESLGKTYR